MGLLLLMGGADYNIRSELFSQNEQGLWLDPSDMTAGKAGWRRNLGINTDALSGSSFTKTNANVNSSAEPAPAGYTSVFVFSEDSATGVHSVGQASTTNTLVGKVANQWNTIHFACKAKERTRVAVGSNSAGEEVIFDLSTGSIVQQGAGVTGAILSLGSGWYRCSYSRLEPSTSGVRWECRLVSTGTTFSYVGDGSSGVYISGFQFEISPTPTEYQRITDFSTEFKAAFPTHTLYQDSNGVTPCTAAGDPVGLIIDQSRGGLGALGPELTTNGGFDSDTWWVKTTGVTIASGVCQYTSVALNGGVYRTALLTAGKFYAVDFTVSGFSSGGVRVYSGGNRTSAFSSNGTYRVIVLAGSADASLIFEATSAGTILALDNVSVREVPGNHAYQSTSGARPTLARVPFGGRRNLLTRTEEFDNAAWTKSLLTVTANAGVAPDGTTTADSLVNAAVASSDLIYQDVTVSSGSTVTFSFYAKQGTVGRWFEIACLNTAYANGVIAWFDLQTGVAGTASNLGTGTGATATITSVGNGWYRCSVSGAIPSTTTYRCLAVLVNGDNSTTRLNNANSLIWGAQLETGSSPTNYQKVTSTHDVTESGFADLWYLSFDGSDDSLVTNSVDFTATDEMTVIAGVRKLSDAATGMVAELSAIASSSNGSFNFLAPRANGEASYAFTVNGGGSVNLRSYTGLSAPRTDVVSALLATTAADSAAAVSTRLNGVALTGTDALSASASGNFGNYVLNIGRRNQTSIPYNGHIYQLIIRGNTTPTGKLLEAERFVARKTGVTF